MRREGPAFSLPGRKGTCPCSVWAALSPFFLRLCYHSDPLELMRKPGKQASSTLFYLETWPRFLSWFWVVLSTDLWSMEFWGTRKLPCCTSASPDLMKMPSTVARIHWINKLKMGSFSFQLWPKVKPLVEPETLEPQAFCLMSMLPEVKSRHFIFSVLCSRILITIIYYVSKWPPLL